MSPKQYLFSRLFECVTATMLLLLGIWLLLWPSALHHSAFRFVVLDHREWQWMLPFIFLAIALMRAAALLANGQWPRIGPLLRSWMAIGGAIIWGEMTLALVLLVSNVGTPPSPGIPIYLTLTVGELIACYMAASSSNGIPDRRPW